MAGGEKRAISRGRSEFVVVGAGEGARGGVERDAAQPVAHERLGGYERGREGRGEEVDGAQGAIGGAHEIFGVEIGHEPGLFVVEIEAWVVAVGAEKTGGDGDKRGRLHAGGIGAFGKQGAEGLFGDKHAFGGHGDDLGGHAVEGEHEEKFFEHRAVGPGAGLGVEGDVAAGVKREAAADAAVFVGQVEFIDGAVGALKRGGLDAAGDGAQARVEFTEQVLGVGSETEGLQRQDGEQAAEGAGGGVELVPEGVGAGEEAYFVVGPEDEIIVRIRADADARRCRAEASERRQSSLVIVLKRGPGEGGGKLAAADAGGLAGEGVLHASALVMAVEGEAWERVGRWQT